MGTVHQNPNDGVVLDMTVAEDLALDRLAEPGGPVGFSHRRIERHAREVADQLGMQLRRQVLRSPVRRLGVSERQLLVLARALASRPEILILDEPTSALSADETDRLFDLVASLVRDGMTVLFVSHKLAEFDRLCRHVGVLRDGAMRGEFFRDGDRRFDWPRVLTALFDRSPSEMRRTGLPTGRSVLALRGVQVFPDAAPFDLDLHDGQVTVLLGLLGSGKTELLEWVFGARGLPAGERELDAAPFAPTHPADAVTRGVYLLAESRHEQAIIPGWPVSAQMTLPFLRRFSRATLMSGPGRAPGRRRDDVRHRRGGPGPVEPDPGPVRRQPAEGDDRLLAAGLAPGAAAGRAVPRRGHQRPARHRRHGARADRHRGGAGGHLGPGRGARGG